MGQLFKLIYSPDRTKGNMLENNVNKVKVVERDREKER